MTITEQLQFSVLAAPVACVDRRALSQAWYSALYGGSMPAKADARVKTQTQTPAERAARACGFSRRREHAQPASLSRKPARTENGLQVAPPDRRAPRSLLAKKIERAFLSPPTPARKHSFTIEGEHGRVHVLLHAHRGKFKLVALCPPKARSHVAAALAQARYSLALRGIYLNAELHGAAW